MYYVCVNQEYLCTNTKDFKIIVTMTDSKNEKTDNANLFTWP